MIESAQEPTASVHQINENDKQAAEPPYYVEEINCSNGEAFDSSDSDRPPDR